MAEAKIKPGSIQAKLFAGLMAFTLFGLFFRWWLAVIAAAVAMVLAANAPPAYGGTLCTVYRNGWECELDPCSRAWLAEQSSERAAHAARNGHLPQSIAATAWQDWLKAVATRQRLCKQGE